MKTIEEAANEYANNSNMITCSLHNAFVAGVEYAERWISIDEELPQLGEVVLVKYDNHLFSTAFFNGKFCIDFNEDTENVDIKFWRPIENK